MKIREIVDKDLFEKLLLLRPAYYDGSVEKGYREALFKEINALFEPFLDLQFYHYNRKHGRIELYFFDPKSGYNSNWIEIYREKPLTKGEGIEDTEVRFRNNRKTELPNPIRIIKEITNKPFSIHEMMNEIEDDGSDDLPF